MSSAPKTTNGKLDLILEMQRETRDDVKDIRKCFIEHEHRITKVEGSVKLRSRIGIALAGALPAISIAIYFLIRLFAKA